MSSVAWLLVGLLTVTACGDGEVDLAKQVVLAEASEESARRELVRLERELDQAQDKAAIEKQIAAQRLILRDAEVLARKLRIQSKQ